MTTAAEHTFLYVDCDVPAGMTLTSWRDDKVRTESRGRRSGILRLFGAR
jgi:hypothetical protein